MGFTSWFAGGIPYLKDEKDIDEALNVIKENLTRARKTEKELREQLKEAKDAAYASKEMSEMKAELEKIRTELHLGFPMTAAENKAVALWQAKHDAEVHNNPNQYHGCSGGGYTFEFYPTAIGTAGICVCDRCNHKAIINATSMSEYRTLMKECGGSFEFQELG
jgi:plasmid stabilization system protein ParE